MKQRLLSATSLMSDDVTNLEDENLGTVKDLMVNLETGEIQYAVLAFGGVLGMGDKYFAIPWSAIYVDTDEEEMVMNIDRAVLEEAEGFDKDDWPQFSHEARQTDVATQAGPRPTPSDDPDYEVNRAVSKRVIWRLKADETSPTPR